MRTTRSLLGGVLTSVLVASLLASAPAGATPPPSLAEFSQPGQVAPQDAGSHPVTLITGDRVIDNGDGTYAIDRGEGRDDVTFLLQRAGDHQYVIPSDAATLVRDGRLDRRLFDITLLREFGYDDRRGDLPLIVTGGGANAPLAAADTGGAEVVHELPVIDGAAARVDKADTGRFWDSLTDSTGDPATRTLTGGVSTVLLDGLRQPLLSESVPQVGAPAAWDSGLDGSGVTVAVLDTGIDASHPDLADQIAAAENFTLDDDDRDLVGHGTHVASTVAGTGAASGGDHRGVAPGADLYDGKVCIDIGCSESAILAGMQWAAEQGADVINMSLGGADTPQDDPMEQAVETLTDEHGVLFVISAGNSGADASVSSPASADAAVAVGAVDKQDQLADFSSRGPRVDGALKPDLTAPGVDIVAANSADGFLGTPGEAYTTLSGTSMASPHVAGAAAILLQQHPDLAPAQVKALLTGSSAPHQELGPYAQGAGRLDVARAVSQSVTTDPPSVSFDRTLWPHDDDQPQTRTVSYVNDGSETVTLELALATTGPDGGPAPDGFFTLSADTVTVPAGGTADVSITVDTSVGDVDGYFGGRLTATGPDAVVTTPFAVDREVESYDVTLTHTGRDGEPTTGYATSLIRLDEPEFVNVPPTDSSVVTVRVPAGEYALGSFVFTESGESSDASLLVQPRLTVDGAVSAAVDAQQAEPISVTVPEPEAAPAIAAVIAEIRTDQVASGFGVAGPSFDGIFSGQLGPAGAVEGLASAVTGTWARPDSEGGFQDTPYTYDLAWFTEGELVTGFTREVAAGDLATVEADHARHVPGAEGWKNNVALLPGVVDNAVATSLPATLPFSRTEYHNTDGGGQWQKLLDEVLVPDDPDAPPEFITTAISELTGYEAGESYRERWNRAVFGPVLPADPLSVSRAGDVLQVQPQPYGDSAGRPVGSPAEGSITVFRDGEQVAEAASLSAAIEVPPEPSEYRVEVDAERDERLPLSTSTSVAWTFPSGHVGGDAPEPLPVSVVRFTPKLDAHNTARAGLPSLIPVSVQPQPGSGAAQVESLTVEVSFDDGETWRKAPVLPWFGSKRALVWHPKDDGFVSLRATATDRDGNTVEQTVIRAYQIG